MDRYNQQRNRKVRWIDNFDGTQTGVAISSCKEGSEPQAFLRKSRSIMR